MSARLTADGSQVLAGTHRARRVSIAADDWVRIDMQVMTSAADWLPLLKDVDAVVNCAGILQDGGGEATADVHHAGPAALFSACEQAGVRRVIHVSAIGVNHEQPTAFSQSKARGEAALMARNLDWVILRPSVIVGRAAYGGSALFRALAALPVLPAVPDAGELQVVQLDDVVTTVLFFLSTDAPTKLELELAGPERLSFEDVVAAYRSCWHAPARLIRAPNWAMRAAYRAGDLAGHLGWRPPIRTNAKLEIVRGATGDPEPWMRLTGIEPSGLREALRREPCTVQERWFAHLYLLKPAIFAVLAGFWVSTAFMALGPGWDIGLSLMYEGGASEAVAAVVVVAGALADLAIGLGIKFRRTARTALWSGIVMSMP